MVSKMMLRIASCASVMASLRCMCVCVCERERERERESKSKSRREGGREGARRERESVVCVYVCVV